MPLNVNDGIKVNAPRSLDSNYLKLGASTYASISEVNNTINISYRTIGLTVNISGVEYWYKSGTTDLDLVIKNNILQLQSDWSQTNSSFLDFIRNKPSLSPVATSGAYSDLTGKPTIPAQVNLSAGTNITITGSYPNLTINSTGSGSSASTLVPVTYSANQSALAGDLDKLVFLNSTSSSITYTINPSTFVNRVLRVYAITGTNTITIQPSSGLISGMTNTQIYDQQSFSIFSDGTNLFII